MTQERPDATHDDMELLRSYEPIVRLTQGEYFFPVAVEDYVEAAELLERKPGSRAEEVVAERGTLTLERLAELGSGHPQPGQYLRFVDDPFSRTQVARWQLRGDRPRIRDTSRLARVGILSRFVDALVRLSLFFRGGVASGTQAAAETKYREDLRDDHHPYYGRVVRQLGYVALQYWFFYAFNDWRSRVNGVNDHEADWEQVVVYLAQESDGSMRPAWVVFSAHDEVGDDLRRRWDDPDLTLVGDHPVVNAGAGSHSGAYLAGEYLTTIEPPAFHRLIRLFRGVTRTLLPWTRSSQQSGIGIPYVDYNRGDGLAIGPGQDREWHAVQIDDDTPWVFDYRGLWGNDTADPLGGERGPAGPRYERSGTVRQSWGDVVGWSGLAKVAPDPDIATELIRARLAELDLQIADADERLNTERTRLRADVASGVPVRRDQERQRDELAARRTALGDERRRLDARLDQPPLEQGPHDHLQHRHVPTPQARSTRRRVLAIWSALSTPVILIIMAIALLPGWEVELRGLAFVTILGLLVAEALARRQLVHFIVTLIVLAAVTLVLLTFAGIVINFGWQRALAAASFLMAILLLAANISELARD